MADSEADPTVATRAIRFALGSVCYKGLSLNAVVVPGKTLAKRFSIHLSRLEGHTSSVTSVAVADDGRRAISGSEDHTLRVWDLESGEELALSPETIEWALAPLLQTGGRLSPETN